MSDVLGVQQHARDRDRTSHSGSLMMGGLYLYLQARPSREDHVDLFRARETQAEINALMEDAFQVATLALQSHPPP